MGVLMSAQWKKIRSVDLKGGDLPSGRMKPWREKIQILVCVCVCVKCQY